MRTDHLLIRGFSRSKTISSLGLLAGLSLALAMTAPAGKGGGGNPGGGTTPAVVPFHYQVHWIGDDTEENNRNYFLLADVAPDGTAVGQFWPLNDYLKSYAVACFPDGSVVNLETLLIGAGELSPDTRVRTAYSICADGLVALSVWDANGFLHAGALQLTPDGAIAAFSVFSDPGGDSAVLCDVSEDGEFLIACTDIDEIPGEAGAISIGNPATMFVWKPVSGTSLAIPGQVQGGRAGWINCNISDYPGCVLENSFYEYESGVSWLLPDPGTAFTPRDVSANGTVIATMRGESTKRNRLGPVVLSRWQPGQAVWEPLLEGSPSRALINGSDEIALSANGNLYVFHDEFGLLAVDDLIDPATKGWSRGETLTLMGFSDAPPGDPYGGVITARLGGGNNGPHVVLIPVNP